MGKRRRFDLVEKNLNYINSFFRFTFLKKFGNISLGIRAVDQEGPPIFPCKRLFDVSPNYVTKVKSVIHAKDNLLAKLCRHVVVCVVIRCRHIPLGKWLYKSTSVTSDERNGARQLKCCLFAAKYTSLVTHLGKRLTGCATLSSKRGTRVAAAYCHLTSNRNPLLQKGTASYTAFKSLSFNCRYTDVTFKLE